MASTQIAPSTETPQTRRYRKAAELLAKWMADDSPYDEQTWAALEPELNDSVSRCQDNDEAVT